MKGEWEQMIVQLKETANINSDDLLMIKALNSERWRHTNEMHNKD